MRADRNNTRECHTFLSRHSERMESRDDFEHKMRRVYVALRKQFADDHEVARYMDDPRFFPLLMTQITVLDFERACMKTIVTLKKLDRLSEHNRQRGSRRNTTN